MKQFLQVNFENSSTMSGQAFVRLGGEKRMYGSKDPACKSHIRNRADICQSQRLQLNAIQSPSVKEWVAVSVVDLATLRYSRTKKRQSRSERLAPYAVELPYGLPAVPWVA